MLWRLDGQFALEDVLPVPQKKPGRHFTSGYQVVGKASASASPYEEKYAKMTYGDHYRKKVLQAIERERRRCAELLEEQRRQAHVPKVLTRADVTPTRAAPRYNLNELRHHQRRCAALLFCAREKGAHRLPVLVKWAPKRRESYYLMSERVYNDRLMMKLRDEEPSPMLFEFDHTDGETDELHDLQKLIQSTSSHLKNMKLDTQFKDYNFDFEQSQKQSGNESGTDTNGETMNEGVGLDARAKRKVTFSDHVTHSDTDGSFARSKGTSQQPRDLDPSDIEVRFSSDDVEGNRTENESEGTSRFRRPGEEWGSDNRFSSVQSRDSSLDLLSAIRGSSRLSQDNYSSDFTGDSSDSTGESDSESALRASDWSRELDRASRRKSRDKLHDNPHCQHSLTRKTNDYYRKLPKLLRTSELRQKLPKERLPKARELGHDVDHGCMEAHRTAYDRALVLARYRTLPSSYSFLARKTTGRNFSYFAGLPGTNKAIEFKGDAKPVSMDKKPPPRAEGRRAIFGDIDMNDFYVEEDELIYYINPEELKQVVASSVSTEDSGQSNEGLTTTSATTSRTATTTNKASSKYESATPSGPED